MAEYTITLKQMIEGGFKVFDFPYDLKPETHKAKFEELFIRHFYFREIGTETPARFKYHLQTELMKLLPYFNKLYMSQGLEQRILDNYDVTETFTKTTVNNKVNDEKVTGTNTNVVDNLEYASDTPVTRVNINENDYVSNISKMQGNNNANLSSNLNSKVNDIGSENWNRTMKGNIGVQTDADAIIKYETSLKNVDVLLLNELEILFMGVW